MIATARGINTKKYARLLSRTLPVLSSPSRNVEAHRLVDSLISKRDCSPEEITLLRLVGILIQQYETRGRAIPRAKPHEMLQFLMDENDLRQRDLLDIFGTRPIVSEVLHGKRGSPGPRR
jgi:HTH-type transcriptional regulator/antitoxin HigA